MTKPEIHMLDVGHQTVRAAIWRGKGNARPVLFFNGIGANLELLEPLGTLMQERSSLITFDMPGIGGSPKPSLPYRPTTITRWASRILDHFDVDDVDVMGISWGGGPAQQFARSFPDRAKTLTLIATSAGTVMVPGQLGAIRRMANPKRYIDPSYMMKNFQALYGENVGADAKSYTSRIIAPTAKGYIYQLIAMAGWTSIHFLPFLKQPTLILAGDKDAIVPLANARILKAMIPKANLKIIKEGGHMFLMSRSDEVVPLITHFLDTHGQELSETVAA